MLIANENPAHAESTRLNRAFNALMEPSKVESSVSAHAVHTTRIEGKVLAKATILLDGRHDTEAVLRHT